MNVVKINANMYKYEFFWREKKDDKVYDFKGELFPYPEHSDTNTWTDQKVFIQNLKEAQRQFTIKWKFQLLDIDKYKDCLLCDKKNIITGLFSVNGIRWTTGMSHYIGKHNIKPSDEFIDFIYRTVNNLHSKSHIIGRLKGLQIIKNDKQMLKLDRNQILIMDALMTHGGKKMYKDCNDNTTYRYSEHFGLLDFNNTGLEKIIISANTDKIDAVDDDIYLPRNMTEALDYEYMFHTHPPTPKPGGRVNCGSCRTEIDFIIGCDWIKVCAGDRHCRADRPGGRSEGGNGRG